MVSSVYLACLSSYPTLFPVLVYLVLTLPVFGISVKSALRYRLSACQFLDYLELLHLDFCLLLWNCLPTEISPAANSESAISASPPLWDSVICFIQFVWILSSLFVSKDCEPAIVYLPVASSFASSLPPLAVCKLLCSLKTLNIESLSPFCIWVRLRFYDSTIWPGMDPANARSLQALFHVTTTFLGFILSASSIQMDPDCIKAVKEWPHPETRKQLQQFLGFTNFYRKFIRGYSTVAASLHQLTSSLCTFTWSPEAEQAFLTLTDLFTTAPILTLPDPMLQFIMEVDTSYLSMGTVLSQRSPKDNQVGLW
ncbi:uncharacterized protein LOC113544250 [Pangasianodon hypophthalmus]|uniref:uncharacterized protein LOC113544250 n=1 Tax=Pangasianodon hypophthalmus TaxID=310915 RepID=UPI0023075986|nr:uncharacterized protein LOC113544250 [Pangasianodon hypophthalmus]